MAKGRKGFTFRWTRRMFVDMIGSYWSIRGLVFIVKFQLMVYKLFINLIIGQGTWLGIEDSSNVFKIGTKAKKTIENKINVI